MLPLNRRMQHPIANTLNYAHQGLKKKYGEHVLYQTGYIGVDINTMLNGKLYVYDYISAYGKREVPEIHPISESTIDRIVVDNSPNFIDLHISTSGAGVASGRVSMTMGRKTSDKTVIGFALVGQPYRFVCVNERYSIGINDKKALDAIPVCQESFLYCPAVGKPFKHTPDVGKLLEFIKERGS